MDKQFNSQPTTENWSQIKAEGQARSQRIGQIFKAAFSETSTEFKTGFNTIRPLAQDLTATVVDDLKGKGQTVAQKVNDAWTDQSDSPDLITRIKAFIKVLLGNKPQQVATQMRQYANQVDVDLSQQYGEGYAVAKKRFITLKDWYVEAIRPAEIAGEAATSAAAANATIEVSAIELDKQ